MKVAFVTNFYNHHQEPLSLVLDRELNGNYAFISTGKISDERLAMGWGSEFEPKFVYHYDEEPQKCEEIINSYDIVIIGSAPMTLIKKRLNGGKITFLYSERMFKKKPMWLKLIKYKLLFYRITGKYKNFHLLCASAFAYYDFLRTRCFKNRGYKWGYFPITHTYENIEQLINEKEKECVSLLSVCRMIDWKHPEIPLLIARKLKDDGINFKLTMIGNGILKDKISELIKENELENNVDLIDHLKPEEVRDYMVKSNIFLFTSDRNEGWGAVLNEAMNSGCAVVGSSEIGSVPFLVEHKKNGFIYRDGDLEDLYQKTKELCLNKELRKKFGMNAYKTITDYWCAETAGKRLLKLFDDIFESNTSNRYASGPCSPVEIIKDNWFKE